MPIHIKQTLKNQNVNKQNQYYIKQLHASYKQTDFIPRMKDKFPMWKVSTVHYFNGPRKNIHMMVSNWFREEYFTKFNSHS